MGVRLNRSVLRSKHCRDAVQLTKRFSSPAEETLWWTASVGISTYPGRHC